MTRNLSATIDAREIMYYGFTMKTEEDLTNFFLKVGKFYSNYPDRVLIELQPFFQYYFMNKIEYLAKENPKLLIAE